MIRKSLLTTYILSILLTRANHQEILSDWEIISLMKKGEHRLFDQLMQRYWKQLFRKMYRNSQNREDAKDLTMEAFEKAHEKIDSFNPDHSFGSWLSKIAQNNFIDRYRKKKKLDLCPKWQSDEAFEYNLPDAAIDFQTPERQLIQDQRKEILRASIQQLKPNHREILELRYLKELSYLEIAEKTGQPIGTVKTNIHRGKEELKSLMQYTLDR